jgi:hypothetical protein
VVLEGRNASPQKEERKDCAETCRDTVIPFRHRCSLLPPAGKGGEK